MKFLLTLMSICLLITSCSTEAKKERPTAQGEPITLEQIQVLPQDSSKNGQLVSVEACSMMKMIKQGKANSLQLRTSANCKEGENIILANIYFSSEKGKNRGSVGLKELRNLFIFEDDKSFSVITDDYQNITADGTKLIFSSKLQFDVYLKRYELNVESIHTTK